MIITQQDRIPLIKNKLQQALNSTQILYFYLMTLQEYGTQLRPYIAAGSDIRYNNFLHILPELVKELIEFRSAISEVNVNLDPNKEISQQYENLLTREIVNYEWINMHQLHDSEYKTVQELEKIIDNDNLLKKSEKAIGTLNWIWQNYTQHLNVLRKKFKLIKIFDSIKDINSNIVLIGANGSGKSTFARSLKSTLSDNFTIIPAQHLLFYDKPSYIHLNQPLSDKVFKFHREEKLGKDNNMRSLLLE